MEWWFSMSIYDINIVLLLLFERAAQSIVIERYEEEIGEVPFTRSRTGQALRAVQQQEITVRRRIVATTAQFHVGSDDLVLEFALLFLRESQGAETDIIIAKQELRDYADFCWGWAPSATANPAW